MPVIESDLYGIEWTDPIDEPFRKAYDPFNHYLFDGWVEDLYPNNWNSIQRGLVIYAEPQTEILAMADGEISNLGGGYICIKHQDDSGLFIVTSIYVYVEVLPTMYIGKKVLRGSQIAILQDRGDESALYVECYIQEINNPSPSSRWGNEGAKDLKNDQWLINPGDLIGLFYSPDPRRRPKFISLTPSFGPLVGGTLIKIYGENFQNGITVDFQKFNDEGVLIWKDSGLNTTFYSELFIETTTPSAPSAGLVDVLITNPDDFFVIVSGGFRYNPMPVINPPYLIPDQGPDSGGTIVTVNGENFRTFSRVYFGGTESTDVRFINEERLLSVTPAHTPGLVDFMLSNGPGEDVTLVDAFTYIPAPFVSSIFPTTGYTEGGTTVIVSGGNFVDGVRVLFDNLEPVALNFISPTYLEVVTPPHEPGHVDVLVDNPDRQQYSIPSGFEYITMAAFPVIKLVGPWNFPTLELPPPAYPDTVSQALPLVLIEDDFSGYSLGLLQNQGEWNKHLDWAPFVTDLDVTHDVPSGDFGTRVMMVDDFGLEIAYADYDYVENVRASQYVNFNGGMLTGDPEGIFEDRDFLYIECRFRKTDVWEDGEIQDLFAAYENTWGIKRYSLDKNPANDLRVYLGGTQVFKVEYANFSYYYNEQDWNTVKVFADASGDNKLFLNGVEISSNSTVWVPQAPTTFRVGSGVGINYSNFYGDIDYLKILPEVEYNPSESENPVEYEFNGSYEARNTHDNDLTVGDLPAPTFETENRINSRYSTSVTVRAEIFIPLNTATPTSPTSQGLMIGIGKSQHTDAEFIMVNKNGLYYRPSANDYTPVFNASYRYDLVPYLLDWFTVEVVYDFRNGIHRVFVNNSKVADSVPNATSITDGVINRIIIGTSNQLDSGTKIYMKNLQIIRSRIDME